MRCVLASLLLLGALPVLADEGYLRYLPSDTRLVVLVHPQVGTQQSDQQRDLALLTRLTRDFLLPELPEGEPLALSDIQRIVLALPYVGTSNGIAILEGKIDRKRLEQQFQAAQKKGELRIEQQGKPPTAVYSRSVDKSKLLALLPALSKVPGPVRKLLVPQELHLTVLDDRTLLLSLAGKTPLVRALRARSADSRPRTSAELTALLRKQANNDRLSLLLLDESLHPGLALVADDSTREAFGQFDHVQLRLHGDKKVQINLEVQGKSAEQAVALETKIRQGLEVFRKALPDLLPDEAQRRVLQDLSNSLRLERKEAQVQVRGELSLEDYRRLR